MTDLARFEELDELRRVCDEQEISYDFSRNDMAWLFGLAFQGLNTRDILRELNKFKEPKVCSRPPIYPGEWNDL